MGTYLIILVLPFESIHGTGQSLYLTLTKGGRMAYSSMWYIVPFITLISTIISVRCAVYAYKVIHQHLRRRDSTMLGIIEYILMWALLPIDDCAVHTSNDRFGHRGC